MVKSNLMVWVTLEFTLGLASKNGRVVIVHKRWKHHFWIPESICLINHHITSTNHCKGKKQDFHHNFSPTTLYTKSATFTSSSRWCWTQQFSCIKLVTANNMFDTKTVVPFKISVVPWAAIWAVPRGLALKTSSCWCGLLRDLRF